jgi:hypothetical protein
MNDNHSRRESKYILPPSVRVRAQGGDQATSNGSTMGGRQAAKSFLITYEKPFPDWKSISLDQKNIALPWIFPG